MNVRKTLHHDLINKISAIKVIKYRLEALLEDEKFSESVIQELTEIIGSCDTTAEYINSIGTELQRLDDSEEKITYKKKLIKLKDFYLKYLPKRRELIISDYNLLKWIDIDTFQFQRVFENCIGNSLKAGANKIEIDQKSIGNVLEFSISDNGKGMTSNELKQIGFGYSTSGGGQGTKIIRDIVNKHSGTIEWESSNTGTTCFIRIPRFVSDHDIYLGHNQIDEDHLEIFSILHRLNHTTDSHNQLVLDLIIAMTNHINREESLMEEKNYPNIERDKVAHININNSIKELANTLSDNLIDREILNEVTNKILLHFETMDKDLVTFLQK